MKILGSVLLGFVVLAVIGWLFIKNAVDKLAFRFNLKGIDPSSLSLQGILKGETRLLTTIQTQVSNQNGFGININNVETEIYYQNNLVAKSVNKSGRIHIDSMGDTSFSHQMNILVNKYSLDLIKNIKGGTGAPITYKVNLSIFGIPFSIEDSYTF